jgi:hypothetical protein
MSFDQHLPAGESGTMVFKTSFDKTTVESLGAFANTQGGAVLIGVKDTGGVLCVTQRTVEKTDRQTQAQRAPSSSWAKQRRLLASAQDVRMNSTSTAHHLTRVEPQVGAQFHWAIKAAKQSIGSPIPAPQQSIPDRAGNPTKRTTHRRSRKNKPSCSK